MLRRIFSPAFVGFFTRKTILLLVAFFVFAVPFLSEHHESVSGVTTNVSAVEGPLWTRTRQMTSEQNAEAHFKKHGKEFGFTSKQDYIVAAHNFIKNPPAGTLMSIQSDGDTVLYNPEKNWFAVKTKQNVPRTLFMPDPNIHGYRTNLDYFEAQSQPRDKGK